MTLGADHGVPLAAKLSGGNDPECDATALPHNPEASVRFLTNRSRGYGIILTALLLATLFVVTSCGGSNLPGTAIDLDPFIDMARDGVCADISNRLFLIDDQMVFWDVAGNCADASYAYTLYGTKPDQVLCTLHDSIAGPRLECDDEQYRDLFETITANLDAPDLGLGAGHTVEEITF